MMSTDTPGRHRPTTTEEHAMTATTDRRRTPSREDVHEHLIPAGIEVGSVRTADLVVDAAAALMGSISAMKSGRGSLRPGATYRAIYRNGHLWMSDTPDEWRDQSWFVAGAVTGDAVLLTGLGLGMTPTALILAGVPRIDIVEIDGDVIATVGAHVLMLAADRGVDVRIHHADVFEWKIPDDARWDYAWHDIWIDLCEDNLPEMTRVRRRFQRRMTAPGRQDCWGETFTRREARRTANAWWR